MSIIDEIRGLSADEARNYLHVNGYDDGDINIVMKEWEVAQSVPVAKVMPEARPSQTPRPAPAPAVEDDEDDE